MGLIHLDNYIHFITCPKVYESDSWTPSTVWWTVSSLEARMAALPLCMARLSLWKVWRMIAELSSPCYLAMAPATFFISFTACLEKPRYVVGCQRDESDPHCLAPLRVVSPLVILCPPDGCPCFPGLGCQVLLLVGRDNGNIVCRRLPPRPARQQDVSRSLLPVLHDLLGLHSRAEPCSPGGQGEDVSHCILAVNRLWSPVAVKGMYPKPVHVLLTLPADCFWE